MREILFRGKRIDNGEWVEGIPWFFSLPVEKAIIIYAMGLLGEEDGVSRYCGSCEVDPKSISQYTGLTDKNGKKVFEGYIVKTHYANAKRSDFVEVVVFRNGRFCVKCDGCYNQICDNTVQHINRGNNVFMDSIEVIGNIYDNPELLEVEYE
jgi:uncharacterized phage protein (TIGR01671 family)